MLNKNIFSALPDKHTAGEVFEELITSRKVKIERIVSNGHSSPKGFWYDQQQDEWVMVLKGSAGLQIEGTDRIIDLAPGDWVNIPAHVKHRVEWTDSKEQTIWLAVYY